MAEKLKKHGFKETKASIANKLARATVSAHLFLAALVAIGCEAVTLEDGRPWGEVAESWQAEDFAALDSGRFRHAYLERPRGHAKTFDLGTEAVTELVLGPPRQQMYTCAADEDQARLLFEDVRDKFMRNLMLRSSVRVTQREVVVNATGSRLRVLSSDAPTAYGLRPDWIAVDELAEWRRRELWDSLWSATGKRPRCRMLVITTAGVPGVSVIAEEVREIADAEADWYFSARGQCASWISPGWLEQQRRTLPVHVFARLHESRWVAGAGAWLTVSEVDGVFAEAPFSSGPVAVGVDLGLARDAAAVAVVRYDAQTRLAVVEALDTWRPRGAEPIDLTAVEDSVAVTAARYGAPVSLESWQGELMGQRLIGRGARVNTVRPTADSRRAMFLRLLELIRAGRLRCRVVHADLRRELLGLTFEEKASGLRVDHKPGGHDDHAVAVALAVQQVAAHDGMPDAPAVLVGARASAEYPRQATGTGIWVSGGGEPHETLFGDRGR